MRISDWSSDVCSSDLPKLPQPVPAGHDYDVADADVLMNRVRIEDGEIVLPEGIRYRILVMPEDRRITRDLLAKLAGYVRDGMWLVGPRVEKSDRKSVVWGKRVAVGVVFGGWRYTKKKKTK